MYVCIVTVTDIVTVIIKVNSLGFDRKLPGRNDGIASLSCRITSIQLTIPLHSTAAFPPLVECLAVNTTVGALV